MFKHLNGIRYEIHVLYHIGKYEFKNLCFDLFQDHKQKHSQASNIMIKGMSKFVVANPLGTPPSLLNFKCIWYEMH